MQASFLRLSRAVLVHGQPDLRAFLYAHQQKLLGHASFSPSTYCKTVLYRDSVIECVTIGWLPKQSTSIHAHPKNGCWMACLSGTLLETCYWGQTAYQSTHLTPFSTRFMHDSLGLHKIENGGESPAISFHVYSPPFFYNPKE